MLLRFFLSKAVVNLIFGCVCDDTDAPHFLAKLNTIGHIPSKIEVVVPHRPACERREMLLAAYSSG